MKRAAVLACAACANAMKWTAPLTVARMTVTDYYLRPSREQTPFFRTLITRNREEGMNRILNFGCAFELDKNLIWLLGFRPNLDEWPDLTRNQAEKDA
jgi:hypothetical protein